jgi:hypothetical protein
MTIFPPEVGLIVMLASVKVLENEERANEQKL